MVWADAQLRRTWSRTRSFSIWCLYSLLNLCMWLMSLPLAVVSFIIGPTCRLRCGNTRRLDCSGFRSIADRFATSIVEDFVLIWYGVVGGADAGHDVFIVEVRRAVSVAIEDLISRIQNLDHHTILVKFMLLYNRHLESFVNSTSQIYEKFPRIHTEDFERCLKEVCECKIGTHFGLKNTGSEQDYLRVVADVLITNVLKSSGVAESNLPRFFLREVLACNLLQKLIDTFIDPNFINQAIVDLFKDTPVDSPQPPGLQGAEEPQEKLPERGKSRQSLTASALKPSCGILSASSIDHVMQNCRLDSRTAEVLFPPTDNGVFKPMKGLQPSRIRLSRSDIINEVVPIMGNRSGSRGLTKSTLSSFASSHPSSSLFQTSGLPSCMEMSHLPYAGAKSAPYLFRSEKGKTQHECGLRSVHAYHVDQPRYNSSSDSSLQDLSLDAQPYISIGSPCGVENETSMSSTGASWTSDSSSTTSGTQADVGRPTSTPSIKTKHLTVDDQDQRDPLHANSSFSYQAVSYVKTASIMASHALYQFSSGLKTVLRTKQGVNVVMVDGCNPQSSCSEPGSGHDMEFPGSTQVAMASAEQRSAGACSDVLQEENTQERYQEASRHASEVGLSHHVTHMISIPSTEESSEKTWEPGINRYTLYHIHYDIRIWPDVYQKAVEQFSQSGGHDPLLPLTRAIKRRYREFIMLHNKITHGSCGRYARSILKPNRRYGMPFGRMDPDVIEGRRLILEDYLASLVLVPELCNSREFKDFLAVNAYSFRPLSYDGSPNMDGGGASPLQEPETVFVSSNHLNQNQRWYTLDYTNPERTTILELFSNFTDCLIDSWVVGEDAPRVDPTESKLGGSVVGAVGVSESSTLSCRQISPPSLKLRSLFPELMQSWTPSTEGLDHSGGLRYPGTAAVHLNPSAPFTGLVFDLLNKSLKSPSLLKWESIQHCIMGYLGPILEKYVNYKMDTLLSDDNFRGYLAKLYDLLWGPGGILKRTPSGGVNSDDPPPAVLKEEALRTLKRELPFVLRLSVNSSDYHVYCKQLLDSLQHPALTRNLLMSLLDVLLVELFPDIKPAERYPDFFPID